MKKSNLVKSFIALGHDSRFAIYSLLLSKGEEGISAGEIGSVLGIPGATLSFHLNNLMEAKLIGLRKEGRVNYYFVRYKRIKRLVKYLSMNVLAKSKAKT